MSNDFLFGDKTLTFMYKYNNIRLIYVNYKSLNTTLKSALSYKTALISTVQFLVIVSLYFVPFSDFKTKPPPFFILSISSIV